jgi:hypothetical protein
MLRIVKFLVSLESSRWGGGCMGFGSMAFGLAVQKFLNTKWFLLKIKLNCSWNFLRNWIVPLVLLERSWWFNGINLVRFGFKMWEILIFKWFLLLKIQRNFKQPGLFTCWVSLFCNGFTLGPTAQATLVKLIFSAIKVNTNNINIYIECNL